MSIPFRLIFAHSKRTWLRTLLTAGSVFIAVFIFGALRMVIRGLEMTVEGANDSRIVAYSSIGLFAHLPARLYPEMKAQPGVKAVTHWTWYGGRYIDDNPQHKMWARFGVDAPDKGIPDEQHRRPRIARKLDIAQAEAIVPGMDGAGRRDRCA